MSHIRLMLKWGADIHARMGADHLSVLQTAATPNSTSTRHRYEASCALLEDVLRVQLEGLRPRAEEGAAGAARRL